MKQINLDGLPKIETGIKANIGKINWNKSIGYKINGIYEDINYEFEIIDYKNGYVTIKYNNKEFLIFSGNLQHNYLGKILGKITSEFKIEIGTRFKDDNRNITVISREYRIDNCNQYRKWYQYHCNKCGHEDWIIEMSILHQHTGCNTCCHTPRVADLGINTIYDTDPWMIPYIGEDCAKTHTHGSSDRIYPICPDCGRVKSKSMAICTIYQNHSIHCICSDGISMPNKIMFNILEQLQINFISEYTPDWIGRKLYDFYIPENQVIVEMDGGLGHGKRDNKMNGQTKANSKAIDDYKDKQAKLHNIEVIRVDCDYLAKSDFEFIKSNILNNKRLNALFQLNKINWNQVFEFSLSNLCKKACKLKINNQSWTTIDVARELKLSPTTIRRYFNKGTKIWDWFYYDIQDEIIKNNKNNANKLKKRLSKPVRIFKDNILLATFQSASEIERQSEKLFGVKLKTSKISLVCWGKKPQYKGFTFQYVT